MKKDLLQWNKLFELPLNEYAESYSTGMLKKLYLMGLLMQKNQILILDEPFNGLDFKSSAFVTALLNRFSREGGTVFVASHDMDHLFSYADTLSLIHNKQLRFYCKEADFDKVREDIIGEANVKMKDIPLFL